MIPFTEISARLDAVDPSNGPKAAANGYMNVAEQVLENWIEAREEIPTKELHEDSRLIALHRQGAKGDPSFNACRETVRELVYRYNLVTGDYAVENMDQTLEMMRHLARHIYLFISGKMENAKLGEFCCSSKSLRVE